MAATGAADVVNVVGRAAAFLGTAIDNAIENTAAVVENVSKRADQMAFVNSPKHGNGNSPNRRRRSSPGKHDNVNGNYRAPLSNLSPNSGLNKASLNNDASSPSRRWNKNPRSPGGRRTPNKGGSKSPNGGNGSNGNNKIRVFRSPGSSGKKSRSRTSGEGSRPAAIPMKTGDTGELADEDWGWDAKSPTQADKTRNVAAATAHLRRELTTVNAERDELVDAMSTLTKKLKALTDDHESLKKQNLGLQKRMASSHHESQLPGGSDPLAEQVRHQLEHLVKEKGKLAQENASLRRECESLQELLMYSNMASQVESMYSPGGIFGDVYGAEETGGAEADEETDGEYVAEETETVETSEAADDEPSEAEAFETGMLEAAEVEVVEETPAADVEAVNADADADAEVEVVEPPEAPEDVVEVVAPAAEPEPEPEPVVAADDIEPEAPAVPEVTEASEAPTGKKGKGKGKGKGKKGRR
jgi:regulator of replication initiation timing